MARPLRLEFPGALYHLTARGNRREAIYLDEKDWQGFLEIFAEVSGRFRWRCHAYCLMTNHDHLVVETPDDDLSRGMRQPNGTDTQVFNRRHNRVGHVFQGRYKSILVDQQAYLLELARYVVLNPVRAGMVDRVETWPWSSYGTMICEEVAPEWLETDWLLAQFGEDRVQAIRAYERFVAEGDRSGKLLQALIDQIYLGDEQFVARMNAKIEAKGRLQGCKRCRGFSIDGGGRWTSISSATGRASWRWREPILMAATASPRLPPISVSTTARSAGPYVRKRRHRAPWMRSRNKHALMQDLTPKSLSAPEVSPRIVEVVEGLRG
jgi:putative transposase